MTAEKPKPKKRKQRPSMRSDLCTLEELAYTGVSNARYQKIAELWSFYVTRGPQVGPRDAKPTRQSLILKDNDWTADKVGKKIKELLFEGDVEFVKQDRDFTAVARKKGFYADSRPSCPSTQAVVKINTYRHSEKDKSEGKPPKLKETQGACILRHIRNALAHGLVYKLPQGRVLLKDHANSDDSAAVSGYILTTLDSLISLMDALKKPCAKNDDAST